MKTKMMVIVALVAATLASGCTRFVGEHPVATERAAVYGAVAGGTTAVILNNVEGGKKARAWAIPVMTLIGAGAGYYSGAEDDSQNDAIRRAEASARTEYVTLRTKGGGSRVVEVYRGADGFFYCRGIRYATMPTPEQLEADGA